MSTRRTEILRFQDELLMLVRKYERAGLSIEELHEAAAERLERYRDGQPLVDDNES